MPRDYKREREKALKSVTPVSSKIPNRLYEDFAAKCELENVTRSAKIKELIEAYVYGKNYKE